MINSHAAYRALTSRDPRFDGIFFVGVTSTGVYCRPICPVKTPLQKNCRFFDNAFAAEKALFRPCLRCRPELAPGHAPIAFPKEDIAVRNSLGRVSTKQAEEISQAWRPWRSYAVMHLWEEPAES